MGMFLCGRAIRQSPHADGHTKSKFLRTARPPVPHARLLSFLAQRACLPQTSQHAPAAPCGLWTVLYCTVYSHLYLLSVLPVLTPVPPVLPAPTCTVPQLKENISAFEVALGGDTLEAIEAVHLTHRNPQAKD